MTALKALKDDGWRVDEVKLREALGEEYDDKMGKDELRKVLSNLDIKDYSEAFLSEGISSKSLKGPIVVQLSKWENVSYPKINEHVQNNGVCTMILTDGAKPTKAMATEPLANISGETPYGTKILLTGDLKLENGILQLSSKNCKFIGGTVEKLVEKWKTEKFSSSKDARNTTDAPKWSSVAAKNGGAASAKKEKDNFKSMAVVDDAKPSETTEFEAARQQEIANLAALKKNAHIASVKLPDNVKKDNTVSEKEGEAASKHEKVASKQEKHDGNAKQDKYDRSGNNSGSNSGNNTGGGSRGNFRKGRNRNNNEDIRNYTSRPSGNATLFDHIKTQMTNPPPESPVKNENTQGNRRNNGGRNDNYEGYNNVQPSGSTSAASDEFAQMKISDVPQDPPHNNGSNYRGGGNRARGGRGRPYYNNYSAYQQVQQPMHFPYPMYGVPAAPMPGYVPPMPQHIRNPNPVGIEAGKSVLAPFPDNNYYLGKVLSTDEIHGLSLVQYNHCNLPHLVHTEYLQIVQADGKQTP